MFDYPMSQNTTQHILYKELLDRLYHIERSFITRRHIKLHYSTAISSDVTSKYIQVIRAYREFFSSVEESQLWFISVELHSRFLAGSKRGLVELVKSLNNKNINDKLASIAKNHAEVIGFIKTQRDEYLAHADDVEWKDFPNVFDKEYDSLLNDIKDLLADIGKLLGSSRIPTISTRADTETPALFDALLKQLLPDEDIAILSRQYQSELDKFLKA